MSVPVIVQDPFSFTQTANTTVTYQPGQWQPVNSDRQTSTAGNSPDGFILDDINFSGNDAWRIGTRVTDRSGFPSPNIFMRLTYTAQAGTFFNITNIQSIILNNYTPTATATDLSPFLRISIENDDGDLYQSPSNTPAPGTTGFPVNFIFDLTVIPGFFNKTNVTLIEFELRVNTQNFQTGVAQYTATVDSISTTLVCVARDTQILMHNGTTKPVQDIQRGDLLAQNPDLTSIAKVARLVHTKLPAKTPVSLVVIPKDALYADKPSQKTIISSGHPILFGNGRYPARSFRSFATVEYHRHKTAGDILPVNDDGTYSLYNIQYEHDGYFVANGLTVDSLPPLSHIVPLPRELYFDEKLYDNPVEIIKPKLQKKFEKNKSD